MSPQLDPARPEWAGFIKAMCASPHDDLIRLAFSDWLADNYGDDHPFPELIRSMVDVHRLDPEAELYFDGWAEDKAPWSKVGQPMKRAAVALRKTWWVWIHDEISEWNRDAWCFVRGFPVFVRCTTNQWVMGVGDKLCQIGPLKDVQLVGLPPMDWEWSPTHHGFIVTCLDSDLARLANENTVLLTRQTHRSGSHPTTHELQQVIRILLRKVWKRDMVPNFMFT